MFDFNQNLQSLPQAATSQSSQMLQYLFHLIWIGDHRDYFHIAAASRTHKGSNFVYLRNQVCPNASGLFCRKHCSEKSLLFRKYTLKILGNVKTNCRCGRLRSRSFAICSPKRMAPFCVASSCTSFVHAGTSASVHVARRTQIKFFTGTPLGTRSI